LDHSGIVLTTGGRRRCTGGIRSSVGCSVGCSCGSNDGSSRNFIVGGYIVDIILFIIVVPEERTPKVVITIHKV
jgi:hypothetical protein